MCESRPEGGADLERAGAEALEEAFVGICVGDRVHPSTECLRDGFAVCEHRVKALAELPGIGAVEHLADANRRDTAGLREIPGVVGRIAGAEDHELELVRVGEEHFDGFFVH